MLIFSIIFGHIFITKEKKSKSTLFQMTPSNLDDSRFWYQGRVHGGGRGGYTPPVQISGGVLPPPYPTPHYPPRHSQLILLQFSVLLLMFDLLKIKFNIKIKY